MDSVSSSFGVDKPMMLTIFSEQIRDHNKTIPAASFTISDLLREQNFGKGEGQTWQQAQWQRKSGRDFKFEDGESLHDVAARAENVIVSYPKVNFKEYQLI